MTVPMVTHGRRLLRIYRPAVGDVMVLPLLTMTKKLLVTLQPLLLPLFLLVMLLDSCASTAVLRKRSLGGGGGGGIEGGVFLAQGLIGGVFSSRGRGCVVCGWAKIRRGDGRRGGGGHIASVGRRRPAATRREVWAGVCVCDCAAQE